MEEAAARIPVSTYRLQFSKLFGFTDAAKIISYLHDLGISDIYCSPYFKSAAGSLHGYDIVDHNSLNPEVGSVEEYEALIKELRKYDMGQVLDIVPNHMCVASSENSWWMDVLENGPVSAHADYFDIDWDPVKAELKNKVLLPILGDQYGRVLENGELILIFEEGSFFIRYFEMKLPIIPKSYIEILKHRLPLLEQRLTSKGPSYTELLSIITALTHLPDIVEKDPQRIAERYREKEIARKRLWNLYNEAVEIRDFVNENVRIFNGAKGDPRSFDLLNELLGRQIYRLSYWRVAADEINYRRFFDINTLAGIRVENPDVFRETHRLIMELVREGRVTGLRVDHPDGLYNPTGYLRQLQEECSFERGRRSGASRNPESLSVSGGVERGETPAGVNSQTATLDKDFKPFYIIGEKILSKGERVPEEWAICGTTGYSFLNVMNGIFVDSASARAFERIYADFTGLKTAFQDIVYEKKKLIMEASLSGEISTLAHFISRMAEEDRHTRDFTLNSLRKAIIEIIAFFPVYRTYINSYSVKDSDRQYVELAVSKAKRKNPAISGSIFDFIRDVLLLRFPEDFTGKEKREWLDFTMRFQQITSPVTAKGIEDTAFYVYNRLVSLNEVGGLPERFGTQPDAFHGQNLNRWKLRSRGLNATSTHDTKRGEDVRARVDVLSEIPGEWRKHVFYWSRLNKKKRGAVDGRIAPDRNEEYFFYQTMLGSWPGGRMDETVYQNFSQRIKDYMIKALREAKINTSWVNVDAQYEEMVKRFIASVLDKKGQNHFLESFDELHDRIAQLGIINSLAQIVLKITSPGIPDFYQGTELWDLNLVDPDNRRPVDYEIRRRILADIKRRETEDGPSEAAKNLWSQREDGKMKMYVIYKALNYRKANRELFESGEYIPLEAAGEKKNNVCAFARKLYNRAAISIVPRLIAAFKRGREKSLPGSGVWGDTVLKLPFASAGMFMNVFTNEKIAIEETPDGPVLFARNIFALMPVALLEGEI